MRRQLVVCCDGTWNKPRRETNVGRTYNHLRRLIGSPEEHVDLIDGARVCKGIATDGSGMVLYYDRGTSGPRLWDWATSGVSAAGLADGVCAAYRFLAANYRQGDTVHLFGFSRGAYTVRSLCGMIVATRGLIADPRLRSAHGAYLRYYATRANVLGDRDRADGPDVEADLGRAKAEIDETIGRELDDAPRLDVKVRFLGVYDAVGPQGLPLPSPYPASGGVEGPVPGFHDDAVSPIVEHAVQVLALDERRGPYRPTLWGPPDAGGGPEARAAARSCLQVWFPGSHSDVGGGYGDKGIGDITLDFMLRRAAEHGLMGEEPDFPRRILDPLAPHHDSSDLFWRQVGPAFGELHLVRPVGSDARRSLGVRPAIAAGREMLHASVLARLGQPVRVLKETPGGGVTEAVMRYEPPNVPWDQENLVTGRVPGLSVFREP